MNFKKFSSRSLLVGSIFACSSAFAGACDTDSCTATIKTLYVQSSGAIYVQLNVTSSDTATLNCALTSGVYFTITPSSTPNFNALYATLLAASTSGHAIDLRAQDNTAGCPVIYALESF